MKPFRSFSVEWRFCRSAEKKKRVRVTIISDTQLLEIFVLKNWQALFRKCQWLIVLFLEEHHNDRKLSKDFGLWLKMTRESRSPTQTNPSHFIQIKSKVSPPKKVQRLVGTSALWWVRGGNVTQMCWFHWAAGLTVFAGRIPQINCALITVPWLPGQKVPALTLLGAGNNLKAEVCPCLVEWGLKLKKILKHFLETDSTFDR